MSHIPNIQAPSQIPNLNYGYVRNGDIVKWTFWEIDSSHNEQKLIFEMNSSSKRINFTVGVERSRIPIRNHAGLLTALGVDWLHKAMPYPSLFMDTTIFELVTANRITSPKQLVEFILGPDLVEKVPPKLFFRSVLVNKYFDTWDKIKIAIMLFMVTDNVHKTADNIDLLTQKFARNFMFFKVVNLSLQRSILLDLFSGRTKFENLLKIFDPQDKITKDDFNFIQVDGSYKTCKNLTFHYPNFTSKAIPLDELFKKKKKSIYYSSIQFPIGIRLIENKEDLILEGKKMGHCVGSYTTRHNEKKSFFLHVSDEEPATVEIRKNLKKRCFEIYQIKGVANKAVPKSVVKKVEKAISTFDAQYFFFRNTKTSKRGMKHLYAEPTLFDESHFG